MVTATSGVYSPDGEAIGRLSVDTTFGRRSPTGSRRRPGARGRRGGTGRRGGGPTEPDRHSDGGHPGPRDRCAGARRDVPRLVRPDRRAPHRVADRPGRRGRPSTRGGHLRPGPPRRVQLQRRVAAISRAGDPCRWRRAGHDLGHHRGVVGLGHPTARYRAGHRLPATADVDPRGRDRDRVSGSRTAAGRDGEG